MVSVWVGEVPLPLVAVTITGNMLVITTVEVPEIRPVMVLMVSPAGNPLAA